MFLEDLNIEERIRHILKTPRAALWTELQADLDRALAAIPAPPASGRLLLELLEAKRRNPANYFKLVAMWPAFHHRGLTSISEALCIYDITFLQESRLLMGFIPVARNLCEKSEL